jgi:hypothetical protein
MYKAQTPWAVTTPKWTKIVPATPKGNPTDPSVEYSTDLEALLSAILPLRAVRPKFLS